MIRTIPTNNNALVEIIKEHEGVARAGSGESPNRGYLRKVSVSTHHLTASSGFELNYAEKESEFWGSHIGKVVRWEEYADSGQKFSENGKEYALVPWWRIIGIEVDNEQK